MTCENQMAEMQREGSSLSLTLCRHFKTTPYAPVKEGVALDCVAKLVSPGTEGNISSQHQHEVNNTSVALA